MRAGHLFSLVLLSALAACGGGGGSTGGGIPPARQATPSPSPSPTASPGAYATLAPASSRQGDVTTRAVGGGAAALVYWPDYNVVAVASGGSVDNAADGKTLATASDGNVITALTYSPATHSLVFSTGTNVYALGTSGPATTLAANVNGIVSMAAGGDGTIYAIAADRVIKISGGAASNVTAPGSIGVSSWSPPSIAVAADGSLFVSDPSNDVIDRVTSTGTISAFAGSCKAASNGFTGTGGSCWPVPFPGSGSSANFSKPGALAYDASSNTLYVADVQGEQLWAVSGSGAAAPVAGYGAAVNADGNGLAAFLNYPMSIAFEPASRSVDILEAAPNSQQEIVAYSAAGSAPPAQTSPATPFYFPNGLTVDDFGASPDGGAWAADNTKKKIVRISPTGSVTTYPVMANVVPSWHLAVDAGGNAWFTAQSVNNYNMLAGAGLLKVTPSGTQSYASVSTNMSAQLSWVAIGPDGNPWFTQSQPFTGSSFGFVDASTQAVTQFPTSSSVGTISRTAAGVAFETTVKGKPGIQFASASGQLASGYQLTSLSAQSLQYRASDSTIWFTDDNGTISSMTASGAEHDYAVCSNCTPLDLAVAPDGSVWSDEGNLPGSLTRITPGGQVLQYFLPFSTGPTTGIGARADGKLWVYSNAGVVYLFDPSAYDAMNGPHATQIARKKPGTGMRIPWHRKV